MNRFLQQSIEYAQQRSYLDDLFKVYPTIPNGIRTINVDAWNKVEVNFAKQDNEELVKTLLDFDIFPIKDSYIAYLKRDKSAIKRNPQTINRIAGELYSMGLDKIYDKCSAPKETNRQIGPMFKNWIKTKALGVNPVSMAEFVRNDENSILDASDQEMKNFAKEHLGYNRDKGLDFLARFNGKYVIGEAKFLTDFGGHQNAQFEDAMSTLKSETINAVKIAILDGVLYINSDNKMHKAITEEYKDENIMSALLLRNFLYSL